MKELLLFGKQFDPHAKGFNRREVMEDANMNGGQACKPDSVRRVDVAACAPWRSFL
jgi:hypothetical protein